MLINPKQRASSNDPLTSDGTSSSTAANEVASVGDAALSEAAQEIRTVIRTGSWTGLVFASDSTAVTFITHSISSDETIEGLAIRYDTTVRLMTAFPNGLYRFLTCV